MKFAHLKYLYNFWQYFTIAFEVPLKYDIRMMVFSPEGKILKAILSVAIIYFLLMFHIGRV